jgi:DNA-binding response OmpR family regulator
MFLDDDDFPIVLSRRRTCEYSADILLVDDDAQLLRAMDRTLRAQGYKTITALGPTAAADVLLTTRFSLVLLDVNMPLRSGLELAHGIRRGEFALGNRHVPIVFVTSDDRATIYEQTYDVSALGFVIKPVAASRLVSVVDAVLHRAA